MNVTSTSSRTKNNTAIRFNNQNIAQNTASQNTASRNTAAQGVTQNTNSQGASQNTASRNAAAQNTATTNTAAQNTAAQTATSQGAAPNTASAQTAAANTTTADSLSTVSLADNALNQTSLKNSIQELQTYLRFISFQNKDIPRVTPTGVFDDNTKAAVEAFQQLYGLPVTGSVDQTTWDEIYSVYKEIEAYLSAVSSITPFPDRNYQLFQGDSGSTVFILQALISSLSEYYANVPRVNINGICDAPTEAAVKALQSIAGLSPTGVIDDRTWDALAALYNIRSYMDWAST